MNHHPLRNPLPTPGRRHPVGTAARRIVVVREGSAYSSVPAMPATTVMNHRGSVVRAAPRTPTVVLVLIVRNRSVRRVAERIAIVRRQPLVLMKPVFCPQIVV